MPFEPERHRGSWVAVDRDDERVVAEAPSLEQLQADLAASTETSQPVLIQRIPADDDPIFVGLG